MKRILLISLLALPLATAIGCGPKEPEATTPAPEGVAKEGAAAQEAPQPTAD